MSGFDNEVLFANNVDFTGTSPVSGQINQNGELLVGASVSPFIRSHVPVGSNGVSVATGPGTIDFSLSSVPNSALANSTINVTAGSGISVVGSPVSLGGNVTISSTSSFTVDQYEVIVGGAGNTLTSVGPGSTGQFLQSGGASANPAYSTATLPSTATGTGTILRADGTNWVASTPTYPNAASTAGKVVVSDGTNLVMSTPTFPNASATTDKVIKSDGTNWVASTETYAAPSTSGNVMTSDGSNWTSSAPLVLTKTVLLTSLQIKALRATPIEIIPAPGSGKGLVIYNIYGKFTYGGTNVFTAGASQAIGLYLNNNTTQIAVFATNATIVANSNRFITQMLINYGSSSVAGIIDNVNLAAWNTVATEITGNAANNNTLNINVTYSIVTY